jgi:hypothetical protein
VNIESLEADTIRWINALSISIKEKLDYELSALNYLC